MPKGPNGEKRPPDVIANAAKVLRIATGEEEEESDTPEAKGKHPAAVSMGQRGGKARANKITPDLHSKPAHSGWASSSWVGQAGPLDQLEF